MTTRDDQPEHQGITGSTPAAATSLLRAQWESYARYHQTRRDLVLHVVFVPLFLAGNVTFVIALIERRWRSAPRP